MLREIIQSLKKKEYFKCRCDEFIKCQKLLIMAFQHRKAKPLDYPAGRQLVQCAPSQKVPLAERHVSLQADTADCWLARVSRRRHSGATL